MAKVKDLDGQSLAWSKIAESAAQGRLPLCSGLPGYGPALQAEIERLAPGVYDAAYKHGLVGGGAVEAPNADSTYFFTEG